MKTISLLFAAGLLFSTTGLAQNVGIGTASPTQRLDVNGGIRIGNTTNGVDGSLRWTGTQLELHDGTAWRNIGLNQSTSTSHCLRGRSPGEHHTYLG